MTTGKNRFDVIGQLSSLRRYARSLTRDDTAAEDLVQDTLLRAYERRASFQASGNLRGWLLSMLHNVFIDGTRSRRSEARRMEQAAEIAERHAEPAQDHVVRLAQVREAFLALPEDQRAAMHLVAIEGLSYQQAAATLAIPVGTLMSRIGRARATLRTMEDKPKGKTHLRLIGGRDD